ncbi:MAG: tRNA (N6-threonylcarbamoyladenosine(37)-N6)-methyltransferase TrmO [Mangrovibacterium sp.]
MYYIAYKAVGIVHSSFTGSPGTPIQPAASRENQADDLASIEIFHEFARGLKDLDGFSHIYVLFHMHLAKKEDLLVTPFLDTQLHGVFATRSPERPNPIGLSVVRLEKIEDNLLYIRNHDIIDCTPVLDIKPYVPAFDVFDVDKYGWLEKNIHRMRHTVDDGRFKS